MERVEYSTGRPGWEQLIVDEGITYSVDGPEDPDHYWNEFASYNFSRLEVISLARQTEELHKMCLEAAHHLAKGTYGTLGLGQQGFELARNSLVQSEFDLYGRMDLVYSGVEGEPVKLLEYNADTPTGIIEAAVSQQTWLHARGASELDWNDLGEALVNRWRELRRISKYDILHLAHVSDEIDPSGEDRNNTWLLAFTAQQAGWITKMIPVDEIIWDEEEERWEDADGLRIDNLFKLYPWEDLTADTNQGYDQLLFAHYPEIHHWVEPAWKMFLSNKVLLAALWELFPGHPNLVEAYVGSPGPMRNWVRKPIFGREGEGITIHAPDYGVMIEDTESFFAGAPDSDFIYQEYLDIPNFPGTKQPTNYPILGSWVVGGRSVGVAVRESTSRVTSWDARFVPHLVKH